ncbi:MAG: SDR family oxidoreductase [Chitinivibrionales bacterium]|nr:SDR family oxidoreductase [Chitinivibrionales bacterium]
MTDDDRGIAHACTRLLREHGARPVLVRKQPREAASGENVYLSAWDEYESIRMTMAAIVGEHGEVDGFIHCMPLHGRASFDAMSAGQFQTAVFEDVKSLFFAAQCLVRQDKTPAWITGTTSLGGACGMEHVADSRVQPATAGVSGLLNSLSKECEKTRCLSLDFDLEQEPEFIARAIIDEMQTEADDLMVGYRAGQRYGVAVEKAEPPATEQGAPSIDKKTVVVVTGGARGITAEIAIELAQRYSPILILLGRSHPPQDAEDPALSGITAEPELKKRLFARLKKSNPAATLKDVADAYAGLIKEREIRRNIDTMRSCGSKVDYVQCDVGSPEALTNAINEIYAKYATISGCIHGAGIIEDKLVAEKDPASFDRVFDTKVASAFMLGGALKPEELSFFCIFSSIAVMGNRGQADYAAANSVASALACKYATLWPGKCFSALWGPWAKTGMASKGVQDQFAQRGIVSIEPEAGRTRLVDELGCINAACQVIFGQGPWDPATDPTEMIPAGSPALTNSSVGQSSPGGTSRALRVDVHRHTYLRDHVVDGKPVLPAAMALELVAETVHLDGPDYEHIEVNNLQTLKGIVFEKTAVDLRIETHRISPESEAGAVAFECGIYTSDFALPHYKARVNLSRHLHMPDVDFHPGANLEPFPHSLDETYARWLFHGECFHTIQHIHGIGPNHISGRLQSVAAKDCFSRPVDGNWLMDPTVIDGSLQLVIAWERFHFDMTPLPMRIRRFMRYHSVSHSPVECRLELHSLNAGQQLSADIYYLNTEGVLLAKLEGLECSCSSALNRLADAQSKQYQESAHVQA